MSNPPSIKSPSEDTTTRWLSNDDGGSLSRKPSENAAASEGGIDRVEQGKAEGEEAPLMSPDPGDEHAHYLPDMSLTVTTDNEDTYHSAPMRSSEEEAAGNGDADAAPANHSMEYQEPVREEYLLPPPDFKPFFTLVEDQETGEHHHPTVHYMFADDDPEILTSAALDAIDKQQSSDDVGSHGQSEEVEERYVILDVAADGKEVSSMSSLSGDWQGLKAAMSPAPSWGGDSNGKDRGLMLKISGHEGGAMNQAKGKRLKGGLDALVAQFGSGLQQLDQVLGRSEHEIGRD